MKKIVSKKGAAKAGTERKTTNRCNRYTMIDNAPSWLDSWSHDATSVEEGSEQLVTEEGRD